MSKKLSKKIQPLITINDQPYLHLDLLNEDTAKQIHQEVVWGMSQTDNTVFSVGDDYSRGDAYTKFFDSEFLDVKYAREKLTEHEENRIKAIQVDDFKKQKIMERYLKFAKGDYFPWRDV